MTACRFVRRLLPLASGGDLPEARQRQVEEHLRRCLNCAREWKAWRDRLGAIARAAAEAPPAPPGLEEAILAAAFPVRRAADRATKSRPWRWAVAAAFVLAAVGVYLGRSAGEHPPGTVPRSWPSMERVLDVSPLSVTVGPIGPTSGATPVSRGLVPVASEPEREPARTWPPLARARRPFLVSDDF